MTTGRQAYRASTCILSLMMVVIGVAMVVSTLARGGGPLAVGVLLGLVFTGVGAGRLYIAMRA